MQLPYETDSLDTVPEAVRTHYTKTANGYKLELTGHQTTEEMRAEKRAITTATAAANERIRALELQSWRDEGAARRAAEDHAATIATITAPSADAIRLEKECADKLAEYESGLKSQVESLRTDRNSVALERVATEVAARLAIPGSHEVLLPHIKSRLVASDVGGRFEITVKNAASVEHLIEEFRADPRFSRLIQGASPVDQARHQQRVAETLGIATPNAMTRAEFEAFSPDKRAAFARGGIKIIDA